MSTLVNMDKDHMIHEAIIFATVKHAVQKRKGTEIPYIVHPMEVMQILTANGCSEKVIVAGILHDTLEDTKTSPAEIEQKFGADILALVRTESEDKSRSWKERKQHTIDCLAHDSRETKLVCCADKLSNILSTSIDQDRLGESVFDRFNAPRDDIKWYYDSIVERLSELEGLPMYAELKAVVRKVFAEN